ncbi:hypothetical protein ETSB_0709 [cyanobacterium endosymbiont of Epithemia turgida isolate EtSB Lake Yunoko]|nr:hypothetical protein ETSB_0709 [cyanobacterium endosymbiont of Epithemia turgida isolate EtSB Lake Yunoko]
MGCEYFLSGSQAIINILVRGLNKNSCIPKSFIKAQKGLKSTYLKACYPSIYKIKSEGIEK